MITNLELTTFMQQILGEHSRVHSTLTIAGLERFFGFKQCGSYLVGGVTVRFVRVGFHRETDCFLRTKRT